jgi:hypothetical protein
MPARTVTGNEFVDTVVREIKGFFGLRYKDFKIETENTDEGTTLYIINLNEPLKITPEKYSRFVELMKKLGFYLLNGSSNQVANYIEYKHWLIDEEFGNDYNDKVYVEYSKEVIKGKERLFIKRFMIEVTPEVENE